MGLTGKMGENAHGMLWRTADSAILDTHSLQQKPGNAGRSHETHISIFISQLFPGTGLILRQLGLHRGIQFQTRFLFPSYGQ